MSTDERAREGAPGTAIATRDERPRNEMLPLHNGTISPDKWAMFGRMSVTVAETEFVPKGLRGKPAAVMACLLYGDSLGLHPSVSLTDVYVADGKVGISGALMLAKIKEAGHKVKFEWILDEQEEKVGAKALGQRIENGEVVEEDEWSYTFEDAARAGLMKPDIDKRAAWYKTPLVMCRWRALAQLTRFLFPDLFRGGSVYVPDEAEEAAYSDRQKLVNGQQPEQGSSDDEIGTEYGDDPLLAAWLVALIVAVNEIEPGTWLPKKVKLALKGKEQFEREAFAESLVAWIEERNGIVPERPTAEEGEYADPEQEEGHPSDDPGEHMNGDDGVAETVVLD